MTEMSAAQEIVEVLVPIIEGAIARRMEEVYAVIEQMREQFQQTVMVMDGNDQAIVAALQELRGVVTGDGYVVEEVVKQAAESWERFVKAEAQKLGLILVTPKFKIISDPTGGIHGDDLPIESIEVRDDD